MRYFLLLVVIVALTVSVSLAKGKGKGKSKGKGKEKEPKPCMVLDDTGAEVKMGKKKLDKCKKNEECTDGPHDNENGDGTFLFFCQPPPKVCKVLDADGNLVEKGKPKAEKCEKPEKCMDGPYEESNKDGEMIQLYFCAKIEPCRIMDAAGQELESRECEMEEQTCSAGPKDGEDDEGNPVQHFFCRREKKKREHRWVACLVMNMTTEAEPTVLQNASNICGENGTCSVGPFTSPDKDIEVYFCTEYRPPPKKGGQGEGGKGGGKEGGKEGGKDGGKKGGKEGGKGGKGGGKGGKNKEKGGKKKNMKGKGN